MTEPAEAETGPGVHRILVALDGEESTRAALDAAARLAAALGAELVGVFVEDTELLEAAELPMTRTIVGRAQAHAPLDGALMRRALRVSAGEAGATIAAVAERLQVKWSFRVIRGTIAEQVLSEARTCDLLALGSAGTAMRRARLEMTSLLGARQAPCSFLLMHTRARADQPVAVLYDGSGRSLAFGRQLAAIHRRGLLVLAAGDTGEAAAAREEEAVAWLDRQGARASVRALVAGDVREVCEAIRNEYPGVLVLDRRGALVEKLSPEAFLNTVTCSVLLLK